MAFWRQLRFLLWKNFLIRNRQKVWIVAELVCPLLLFLILVLLRREHQPDKKPECHYAARALPSVGFLPFVQSYFCTIQNTCEKNAASDSDIGPTNVPKDSLLLFVGGFVENYFGDTDLVTQLNTDYPRILEDMEQIAIAAAKGDIFSMGDLKKYVKDLQSLPSVVRIQQLIEQASESSGMSSNDTTKRLLQMFSCGKLEDAEDGDKRKATTVQRLKERLRGKKSILEVESTEVTALRRSNITEVSVCKGVFVDPPLNQKCQNWLTSSPMLNVMAAAFMPMLRGFILVSPDNNVTQTIVSKMQRFLQAFDFLRTGILDLNQNADNYQDAVYASKLAKLYNDLIRLTDNPLCMILAATECKELAKLLKSVEPFFVDSSNSKAFFPKLKKAIQSLVPMFECFRTDRFIMEKSEEAMEERGVCLTDSSLFFAGLVFEENATKDGLAPFIEYKIRMPDNLVHGPALTDRGWSPTPRDRVWTDLKYQSLGFQFLQDSVDRAIIEMQTNQSQKVGVYLQQFANPCWQSDEFVLAIERTLPMLMVMAWVCTASLVIKNIVYEKEIRLKEFMKVMGLGNLVHWVAWFIQTFVFAIFSVLVFVVVIKYGRVVQRIDFFVLFFYVMLFLVATITQCFLISTFFAKANVAAASGAVIYFLCYVPYWVVIRWADKITYAQKMLSCLFAQVAFGWGCSFIAEYEGKAERVYFENLNQRGEDNDISLQDAMIMMMVDSAIHLLLTWYIETVWPGEYGIPRPFYFFLTKSYWCGTTKAGIILEDLGDIEPEVKKNTEAEPTQLPLGVAVRNLKKVYSNGKVALSGVSLNFYESQITSFLGHNGAGKTTTLSILTGLFPPTEGTVMVYGNDVRTRIDEIRKSLGMCPQHNILFGSLTVRQQLTFFAGLKGVPYDKIPHQVKEMIEELALTPKADTQAQELSGGNQRRLAVAAAFIGGSKTVILDEPTAGVDPCARRLIWDLLLRKKEGRTIILSTHFMDEADVLGDRIAIIGAGRLRCCGSSMFLKKCYGSGYRLTMVRKCPSKARFQLLSSGLTNTDDSPSPAPSTSDLAVTADEVNTEMDESSSNDKRISDFVTKTLPGSTLVEDVGQEFTYNVPSDNPKALHEFFVKLESNMVNLGVSSYGVSETKLEEIFLKSVGDEGGEEEKVPPCPSFCPGLRRKVSQWSKRRKNRQNPIDDVKLMDSSEDESDSNARDAVLDPRMEMMEKTSQCAVMARHLKALLTKRLVNFSRNFKGAFCEILLPVLLIVIVLKALSFKPPPTPTQPGEMSITQWYYTPEYIFQKFDYPMPSSPEVTDGEAKEAAVKYMDSMNEPPGMGITCMKNNSLEKSCNGSMTPVLPPQPRARQNASCHCDDRSIYECEPGAYQPAPPIWTSNTSDYIVNLTTSEEIVAHNITQWLLMTEKQYRQDRYGGFSFGDENIAAYNGTNGTMNWAALQKNVEILVDLFRNFTDSMGIDWRKNHSTIWIPVEGSNGTIPLNYTVADGLTNLLSGMDIRSNVKIWFNNQGWISGPAFASVFSNAVLRAHIRDTAPHLDPTEYGILPTNHKMNQTKSAQAASIGAPPIGRTAFEASMIMLAFCIIPASFVLFIIEETVSFSKHLQFVTGVRPIVYWVSNFIWDMANFMIPVCLVMVVLVLFKEDAYVGTPHSAGATFVLLVVYGFAIIPMMYPFTFVFRIPSLAFIVLTMASAFIGWILSLTTFILELLGESERETNKILKLAFLIFPQFCLGRGLMDIKANYYEYEGMNFFLAGKAKPPNLFRWTNDDNDYGLPGFGGLEGVDGIGRSLFCLAISGCVWFLVTLIIEYSHEISFSSTDADNPINPNEDEDVRLERERIMTLGNREPFALKIKNLSKVFKSGCGAKRKALRAVDNLCVGVKTSECFGLLGVNGAGKTTTFSMLTGKLNVTSGDALINGSSILSNMAQVCHQIGFCPQFDALHPLLTGREELRFYARLRGVKSSVIEKVVSRSIVQLGLKIHADRQAGTYSGGNKRKLSTAISMIGHPAVVLLDEPTTGMDPKARRFLWNRIMEVLRDGKTSIVLTSHSMEECEALCHRIGIMVNGRFQCLGSPQHLKSRFGQGYTLTIKIGGTKPKTEEAIEFVKQRFPGVELKEQHLSQLRFQLPPSTKALSDVFACMVEAVKVLQVDDYTLCQTTLEEVFVSFAREQGPGVVSEAKERKRSSATAL